ncbi:sugar porter family MFS transporter [Cyclobacterium qasimii]|uniref:D-xylose proton-symporter XylE n=2 Tax=Cyclobacterium qasimii TaxID=1350429 RepID=S7VC53_9BACT|nr:sugar porter family MFS transporter [Cyclobacterium qasimii]EPR67815.1 D-xylose proton-symporter XylE [Cyclobacterium qasimii M12-11B]GEO20399.1 MFS transporter [Cyclobacterium qasimii]
MKINPSYLYILFLSLVAAIGGFLFGYDTAVISGTISQVSQQFELSVIAQGWYVGCALLGSIIGVSFAGGLSDKYGRKKVMLLSAVLFSISAIGCAIASSYNELILYRIIGGAGIGMVSIVSPMYISEVAPSAIRGSLVSLYQLAITIGFLGAFLMNFQLLSIAETQLFKDSPLLSQVFHEEVWRAMLGMEIVPAFLFFIVLLFIPESPRWLVINNQIAKAEHVFTKLYTSAVTGKQKVEEVLKQADQTTESSWGLLKNPLVLKPVLLGMAIAILGQFMGVNAVLYYGPSIFEQSGLSGGDALYYQVMVGVVNVLTTILALFIIDRVGRKKLVYFGVSGMVISLLLISFYFYGSEMYGLPSLFLLILFLAYIFFTAISISAVIFVLLSEMYPNKIRGLAMSIAGFSLWLGTYLVGQLTPWFLENLGPSGTFLFFALMCFPYMYIIWKKIPETAGRSLEEIENYWFGKGIKNK